MPAVVRFTCPSCRVLIKTSLEYAGRAGRCPKCGQHLQVPFPSPPQVKTVEVAVAEDVLDVIPADPPEVLPAGPPLDRPLPIPRFITDGALVKCIGCPKILRVNVESFNRIIDCECGERQRVIVAPKGRLIVRCQTCGCEMTIGRKMAGRPIRCVDCKEFVTVPTGPIHTERTSEMTGTEATVAVLAGVGFVAAALNGGWVEGPRQCVRCGRYLRNPSPYCHLCQPH